MRRLGAWLKNKSRQFVTFWVNLIRLPENRYVIYSGLLMALAFPPFELGFLMFGAMIPLMFAVDGHNWLGALRKAFFHACIFYLGINFWIIPITFGGFWGMVLAMGIYQGVTMIVLTWFRDRWGDWGWLTFPFLWGTMEWLRSLGIMGYPWGNVGYALGPYTSLIQVAAITSVGGLSFWLVLVNTLGFLAIKRRSVRLAVGFAALLLGGWIGGYFFGQAEIARIETRMAKTPSMRVALLQGNIDQDQKWSEDFLTTNFNIYGELSRIAARYEPDLIVWPETAATCYITSSRRRPYLRRILRISQNLRIPMLIGSLDYRMLPRELHGVYPRDYQVFNSIFYFAPDRFDNFPRYHKNRLVPFAEWIPLSDHIPLLKKLQFGQADFTPALDVPLFTHPKGKIAGFICFESVFPRYTRELINLTNLANETQYLINVTNDAWFGMTSAPYQHASLLKFRAIETRTGIGRSANTGISTIYDPVGRLVIQTGIFHKAMIVGELSPNVEQSFFLRHGDIFDQTIFGVTLVLIGLVLGLRLRKR